MIEEFVKALKRQQEKEKAESTYEYQQFLLNKIAELEAKKIAENCTKDFIPQVKEKLIAFLLYVRFSKSIPIEKKSFSEVLKIDLNNLIIDCRKDNGKKWSGMNTLLKCLFCKLG